MTKYTKVMYFDVNLDYLRKKAGVTYKTLTEETGISDQSVRGWANGRTSPTITKAAVLAEYFNVSLNDFCFVDLEKRDRENKGNADA